MTLHAAPIHLSGPIRWACRLIACIVGVLIPLQSGAMVRLGVLSSPSVHLGFVREPTEPHSVAFAAPGGFAVQKCRNDPVDNIDPLGLLHRKAAGTLTPGAVDTGLTVADSWGEVPVAMLCNLPDLAVWGIENLMAAPARKAAVTGLEGVEAIGKVRVGAVTVDELAADPTLNRLVQDAVRLPALALPVEAAVMVSKAPAVAGVVAKALRGEQALAAEARVAKAVEQGVAGATRAAERNGVSLWTKAEFRGTRVYQRNDLVDLTLTDKLGRSNLHRMQEGLAPLGPDGKPINLHHMLQSADSPIAEVSQTFHQQYGSVIHINPSTTPSGINRSVFDIWRSDYWINRADGF